MIVTVAASAFSSDSLWGDLGVSITHFESRWQVWTAAPPANTDGQNDSGLLHDTWYQSSDLESFAYDYEVDALYWVRVQFRDNYGFLSDWSEALPLNLLHPPEIKTGRASLYLGSAGDIYEFDVGPDDDGEPIRLLVRSYPKAPNGAGGESLFSMLKVHTTNLEAATIRITPIVNGARRSAIALQLPAHAEPTEAVHEVPLFDPYTEDATEQFLYGLRGTWFEFEATCALTRDRHLAISAAEVEEEPLRETLPGILYSPDDEIDVQLPDLHRLLLGGADGAIRRFDFGVDDDGEAVDVLWETMDYAVAGIGGEMLFEALYVMVLRHNLDPFSIVITPYVDGVAKEPVTLSFAATSRPVLEVHEVYLSQPLRDGGVEWGREGLRGCWFRAAARMSGARPRGELHFPRPVLMAEVVRETQEGTV